MCLYIYLVLGIWIFTALITHHFLVRNKKNSILKDVQKKLSNVLFLIAHPDDECMFFGPAITSLTCQTDSSSSKKKAAKNIYILCLSDGKYPFIRQVSSDWLQTLSDPPPFQSLTVNFCSFPGNAEGLGKLRKEEFFKSCRLLGIHESNIILHEYYLLSKWFRMQILIFYYLFRGKPQFIDSQSLEWDPQTVAETIHFYIQKFKINNVRIVCSYCCCPED